MSPREIHSYRTQAIVLGHRDYDEADRILRVFTFQKGKITAIAKGVRRIRSRKAGHLEPFTRVTLLLAKGRNMDIVTQAETVDNYPGLRTDLQRIGYASYVVEILDRFTYEEGQNIAIFRLLANTLKRLEDHPNPTTAIHYYELRLLDLVGFRPQLFECVDCGKPIQAVDQFFSPLAGGIACPQCGKNRPEAWPINMDTLRYFRHLQRSNWEQVSGIVIPGNVEPALADLVQRYISYILERKLNSPNFIKEIQRNNQTGEN